MSPPAAWFDDLVARLDAECSEKPFVTAWSLVHFAGDHRANRFGARRVPAASTRKVAVMLAALAAADRRELDLGRTLVIDERYRDEVFSGTLQHLEPGLRLSLLDAIKLMIILSDNLCTAHVLDVIDLAAVNDYCQRVGLSGTRHLHAIIPALDSDHPADATNFTTADDQALLLDLVVRGRDDPRAAAQLEMRSETCAAALDILLAQQHYTMLPALLPHEAQVAHKHGVGWRDVSNIGVVLRKGRPLYALSVYVDELSDELPDGTPGIAAGHDHVARLSRLVWDATTRAVPIEAPDPR